jgi:RNA polymerase sigma-70 factor (ECF subfamily)
MDSALLREKGLRLLMSYRSALHAYIFASVRNHADAEDIWQDVAVAVMESVSDLQDEQQFLPWAREIARRRVLAHHRKSTRQLPLDPTLMQALSDASDRVERQSPTPTYRDALMECLDKLPDDSRRILSQRYEGACNLEDLAKQAGRSIQGLYALLKRLRMVLRDCVNQRVAGVSQ